MTGRRVPYLVQRGSVFQVRLPVPRHLQAVLVKKELQRSIHTSDYAEARRIALRAGSRFADLCASIERMTDLSAIDLSELIDRFFADLIAGFKPSDLGSLDDEKSDYEWGYAADYQLTELSRMLGRRKYSQAIQNEAATLLEAEGQSFSDLSELDQAKLLEGVARARQEHIKFLAFRQNSLLDPYIPTDPLFNPPTRQTNAPHAATRWPSRF